MDDGQGKMRFAETADELAKLKKEYPDHGGTFKIGDTVWVRDSLFKVIKITPKRLTLRVLKRFTERG